MTKTKANRYKMLHLKDYSNGFVKSFIPLENLIGSNSHTYIYAYTQYSRHTMYIHM